MEENLFEGFRLLQGLQDVQWHCENDHEFFATGCEAAWLNGVLYCNRPSTSLSSFINQTSEHFRSLGLTAVWRIGLSTIDRLALSDMLLDLGFEKISNSPEMILDLNTIGARRENLLEFVPLTEDRIDDWLRQFAVSFELGDEDRVFFRTFLEKTLHVPNCTFKSFIGFYDGEAVSCGSISFFGEVPVIYNIATNPAHRRKGYGTAITQYLASHAKERGFQTVGLFSTEAGFHVYKNLGFSVISEMENYLI